MPSWPDSMKRLTEDVRLVPDNRTVADVVERLEMIEKELDGYFAAGDPAARRGRDPLPDGVACFNGMYLQVTKAVGDALPAFENPRFVERLDVVFAEFFIRAYEAALAKAWISKAWSPLFERKDERGPLPLQFALAGMNAHINNDLAHALVLTWEYLDVKPSRSSPEYRDYLEVNKILDAVQHDVRGPLADDFIRTADGLLGTTDDVLAMWSIGRAREHAWVRGSVMLRLDDDEYEALMDRLVGYAGHLLLRPTLRLP